MRHQFPVVVEDKPVMTSDKLFSSVGGVLSLWLGLNFMFFVEIVELIVSVVRDRFFKNHKTEAAAA